MSEHPLFQKLERTAEEALKSQKFWEGVMAAVVSAVLSRVILKFLEKRGKA